MSFAKSLAGFKISKIREHRVTCYMDEFMNSDGVRNYCGAQVKSAWGAQRSRGELTKFN